MKIIVTGGSGMVGSALKKIADNTHEWIFLSSKDGDLRDLNSCLEIFEKHKPNYIIHLAANVGGLYKNLGNNVRMMSDNLRMNENILQACDKYNVNDGIFCLSSCIYPYESSVYPMTEDMLHNGPPHPSNEGYGYSKRIMEVQCRNYNEIGKNYICVSPVNLYGENDNFSLETGHVIGSLITKFYNAKKNNTTVPVFGDGSPLRQFVFVDDFAQIIIKLMNRKDVRLVNIANDEVSIKQLVETLGNLFDYHNITYDATKSNGCLRKTVSNKYFYELFPDFEYTSLENGLKKTIDWFLKNKI
jgi:GDP-L-fucose synthase